MMIIDTAKLLAPVAADRPCGEDLANDQTFVTFKRAIDGAAPQRMVGDSGGDSGPDWRKVSQDAQAWLERSKDLQVAVILLRGLLHQHGVAGLAAGLELIHRLLDQYWDTVFPQLDPEDGDATQRLNTLRTLSNADAVVTPARRAPLVQLPPLGSFGLRAIGLAAGEIKLPAGSTEVPPSSEHIEAAFKGAPLQALQQTASAVDSALQHLRGIEETVATRLNAPGSLRLPELADALQQMKKVLAAQLGKRDPGPAPTSDANGDGAAATAGTPAATGPITGQVRGRSDVIRLLDLICEYYANHEPSSPVPVLLRRCQRLVPMDFADIVRELVPGGFSEFETIRGKIDAD